MYAGDGSLIRQVVDLLQLYSTPVVPLKLHVEKNQTQTLVPPSDGDLLYESPL